MAATAKWSEMLNFIWTIRDKDLRFYYERSEVGDVVLRSLGGGFVDCAVRDTYM